MIHKNENIINAQEPLIAHGCNAQGKMNSGVAKAIREKYPQAYQEYKNSKLKLGDVIYAFSNNKIIANCITQEFYGNDNKRYVDYEALGQCLENINDFCYRREIKEIAMPMIGSGLGGGYWDDIQKIIMNKLTSVTPIVYYI